MNIDLNLLEKDLKRDEGIRLKPYQDTTGHTTIGIGRNLDDVGISRDEAMYLLDNDMAAALELLDRELPWHTTLSEPRQRALANMAFNMGPKLVNFVKMLSALKEQRWEDAATEALNSKWAKQTGLRAQRIAEVFRGG